LLIPADILKHDSVLEQLHGKIDIIWSGALLHLFDWKHQVTAVRHMLKLLKPSPHSLIVGRLMGNTKPGPYNIDRDDIKIMYRHDLKSFKKMFHEACDAVGQKWETDVQVREWRDEDDELKLKGREGAAPEGTLEITFVATKLERLDMGIPQIVW
jgi:hypothetical protein